MTGMETKWAALSALLNFLVNASHSVTVIITKIMTVINILSLV